MITVGGVDITQLVRVPDCDSGSTGSSPVIRPSCALLIGYLKHTEAKLNLWRRLKRLVTALLAQLCFKTKGV